MRSINVPDISYDDDDDDVPDNHAIKGKFATISSQNLSTILL